MPIKKEVSIAIFYSKEDKFYFDKLDRHLCTLTESLPIRIWHEGKITVGEERNMVREQCIKEADIILILLSSDLFASNFYKSSGMELAIQCYRRREKEVVPILIRHCNWQDTELGKLGVFPRSPITDRNKWQDIDEAYFFIIKILKLIIGNNIAKREVDYAVQKCSYLRDDLQSKISSDYSEYFDLLNRNVTSREFTRPAHETLGFLFHEGLGTKSDIGKAVEHYFKAADRGNRQAMNGLGEICLQQQNYVDAMYWFKSLAKLGESKALNYVGDFYAHGKGVEKDIGKAIEYYLKSVLRDNPQACISLARIFSDYNDKDQIDLEAALLLCEKAKKLGYDSHIVEKEIKNKIENRVIYYPSSRDIEKKIQDLKQRLMH